MSFFRKFNENIEVYEFQFTVTKSIEVTVIDLKANNLLLIVAV